MENKKIWIGQSALCLWNGEPGPAVRWADRVVSTDVASETWGKDDQTEDTAAELSTKTELYTVNAFLSVRLVWRGIPFCLWCVLLMLKFSEDLACWKLITLHPFVLLGLAVKMITLNGALVEGYWKRQNLITRRKTSPSATCPPKNRTLTGPSPTLGRWVKCSFLLILIRFCSEILKEILLESMGINNMTLDHKMFCERMNK